MEIQTKDIHDALNHLLDLKQKQSNVWEARSAREGAEETSRQGNVMVVFTMVTIIFLPLSFMASFFALNVAEFPSDDRGDVNWPLHQVASLLFGLSFAVSIPFILMAFSVGFVRTMYHWILNSGVTRMLVLGLKWVPLLRNTTFTRMAEKWSEDATQRQWEYTHASKKKEEAQQEGDKEKERLDDDDDDDDDDDSMNSERRKQYRRHIFGVISDLATKQQQRLTRRPTNTTAVTETVESKV